MIRKENYLDILERETPINIIQYEEEIEKLKEIIIGIRNLRASSNVHPSKKTLDIIHKKICIKTA